MREIEDTLRRYPRLECAFGKPVRSFLKTNSNPLENRLIQRLYMGDENRTAQGLDMFLKNADELGLNINVPLQQLGRDLRYASIIAEIRAGIWLKERLDPESIEFIPTTEGKQTADLCLTLSGKTQFVEVKSLHESNYFGVLSDKLDERWIKDRKYSVRLDVVENADFDNPAEPPVKLSCRMKKHADLLLDHIQPCLEKKLPLKIEEENILRPFLDSLSVDRCREPSIMSGPGDSYLLDEAEPFCLHALTRGLLSRFVNQVTQAYWKLYTVRGSQPNNDRIVMVLGTDHFPFDEEVKDKLEEILATWGIS